MVGTHQTVPHLIGHDSHNQQNTQHHHLHGRPDVGQVHAVLNQANEDGAQHDVLNTRSLFSDALLGAD